MGKKMTAEQMERILSALYLEDKNQKQAAEIVGVSEAAVSGVVFAYKLCKAEDWQEIARRIVNDGNITRPVIEFTANKLGKKLPPLIEKAIAERAAKTRERHERARTPATPAPAPVKTQEPVEEVNEKIFFIRVLEETMKMNELLAQLMDVVIPKYTGDLKDCFGINTDLITQRLETCERRLEKIEYQTRKRGL